LIVIGADVVSPLRVQGDEDDILFGVGRAAIQPDEEKGTHQKIADEFVVFHVYSM
jgi:hypothetical protein